MAIDKALDNILNTGSKVKIIRLFTSRREDFMASGREIAKLVNLTPPAAHAALKELHNQDILKRDIIGRQHIYKLNGGNRIVKNILIPAFKKEHSIKKDIVDFLKKRFKTRKVQNKIISAVLYGSLQTGVTDEKSDIDIAVITKNGASKEWLENVFTEEITNQFYDYFGVHLDTYIKTKDEFTKRLKKNQSPISTLMQSYFVIYGKDPIEFK